MWVQATGFLLASVLTAHVLLVAVRRLSESRAIDRIATSEIAYLRTLTEEAEIRTRVQRERLDLAWHGWRKFRIISIKNETDSVKSFYLVPHDKKPLPHFLPGQHITLRATLPGRTKPVVRCYSLSCAPNPDFYRISVKREGPRPDAPHIPAGLVSNFLHDEIKEGDFIDLKSPSGSFNLDLSRHTPIVLIGGGIGITPVFSMLDAVIAQESRREVWFFLGVRSRHDHAMHRPLVDYAKRYKNLRLIVCYSDPTEECKKGENYHHHGVVSVELIHSLLSSSNYDFYFCGPPGMMTSLHDGLLEWGVPEKSLHYEAFGPATVGKIKKPSNEDQDACYTISFLRSKKKIAWNSNTGSLLDLAEMNGIQIDSGCRAGNCGTCTTAIKSGEIDYLNLPGQLPEEGTCLVCAAIPTSDLELDA